MYIYEILKCKVNCKIIESDEHEGCHIRRGLECDTAPPMVSGHQVDRAVSGCGTLARSRHFLVCTLLTPDLNNSRIRVSLPSHEDTVSGPCLAHNLQVPQILSIWSSRLIKRTQVKMVLFSVLYCVHLMIRRHVTGSWEWCLRWGLVTRLLTRPEWEAELAAVTRSHQSHGREEESGSGDQRGHGSQDVWSSGHGTLATGDNMRTQGVKTGQQIQFVTPVITSFHYTNNKSGDSSHHTESAVTLILMTQSFSRILSQIVLVSFLSPRWWVLI